MRECSSHAMKQEIEDNYPELNPEFIFKHMGFNMRNTEIGGILGLSQLPRLSDNIKRRTENLHTFIEFLDSKKYQTEFRIDGSSNYAFNLIVKDKDLSFVEKLMRTLKQERVEFRRGSAGGGNQLRQPYLKNYVGKVDFEKFPVTEHVHFFGFYLGNYPSLKESDVKDLIKLINSI